MKIILTPFLVFLFTSYFGQVIHKSDSVFSYGELVQINSYNVIEKTIYLKQKKTKFNQKQEGLLKQFDSIP